MGSVRELYSIERDDIGLSIVAVWYGYRIGGICPGRILMSEYDLEDMSC